MDKRLFSSYVDSAKSTLNVVALRWATVRSFRVKAIFALVAYFVTLVLGLMINVGVLFAELATLTSAEEGSLARAWLSDVADGNLELLSIAFIGTGLGIMLMSPFTGASSLTLIDEDSSMPYGFARGRRYFDSVAFSSISAVSIIHLLVGVLTASLLSISGNRFFPILLATVLWLGFLFLSSMFGWLVEVASLYLGKITKWLYAGLLALGLFAVYSLSFVQDGLLKIVQQYGLLVVYVANASLMTSFLITVLIIGLVVSISLAGLMLVRKWDSSSPHLKPSSGFGKKRYSNNSDSSANLFTFIVKVFWRTREIKRTLIAVTLVGAISATYFFSTAPDSILMGITIGIPAVSALIWSANAYGPFGSGLTWLLGQPRIKNQIGLALYSLSLLQTLAIAAAFILPISIFNSDALYANGDWWFLVILVINAIIITNIASLLSIYRPYAVRLSGKGESILPPSAAIGYLFTFGASGGASTALTSFIVRFSMDETPDLMGVTAVLAFVIGLLLFSSVTIFKMVTVWNKEDSQKKLIAIATGD